MLNLSIETPANLLAGVFSAPASGYIIFNIQRFTKYGMYVIFAMKAHPRLDRLIKYLPFYHGEERWK